VIYRPCSAIKIKIKLVVTFQYRRSIANLMTIHLARMKLDLITIKHGQKDGKIQDAINRIPNIPQRLLHIVNPVTQFNI